MYLNNCAYWIFPQVLGLKGAISGLITALTEENQNNNKDPNTAKSNGMGRVSSNCSLVPYISRLVQERCNSSALAMELCLSCTNPSTCTMLYIFNQWYLSLSCCQNNRAYGPETTILVPYPYVKSPQHVCKLCTCRFHLPSLQQWLFDDMPNRPVVKLVPKLQFMVLNRQVVFSATIIKWSRTECT